MICEFFILTNINCTYHYYEIIIAQREILIRYSVVIEH